MIGRVTTSSWSPRPARIALVVTAILTGLLIAEFVTAYGMVARAGDLWIDYVFYRDIGAAWLADGTYYMPRQLTGEPYHIVPMVDVLYPPNALLVFVPLVFLPAVLWWIVPIAILVLTAWRWRPAPWTWPLIVLLLMWPRANGAFLFGNTDMLMAAGVAAGLAWGWPAVLLTLKPTLAPLALVGANRRVWWAATGALIVVSLAAIPLWIEYVAVLRNLRIGIDYSLGSLPLMLVPMVAWLGRHASADDPWRSKATWRRATSADAAEARGSEDGSDLRRPVDADAFGNQRRGPLAH